MEQNLKPPEVIAGSNIILRAREVSQSQELFAVIDGNRQFLSEWLPWVDKTLSVEDSKKYLEFASSAWEQQQMFDFSLYEKSSGVLVGSFGIHEINWQKSSCEMGYWLAENHQGKGFISEAVQLVEDIVQKLGFRRVLIKCDRRNIRSQQVPLKLGYRLESTEIDECMNHQGKLRDTLSFAKILNKQSIGLDSTYLPVGYSIEEVDQEKFWSQVEDKMKNVFQNEVVFRSIDYYTEEEKERLSTLGERFSSRYQIHLVIKYQNQIVGWTWGYQDSRESFYMVNSGIVEEHRGRGLYSSLLQIMLKILVGKGFQRIWSRHVLTNNPILIAKLKQNFLITSMETSDVFGVLLHLTYFASPKRRKILRYRVGHCHPDEEILKHLTLKKQ